MFCADANPWDPAILCAREVGHAGLHEATQDPEPHRWAGHCHFDGDGCPAGAHLAETTTEVAR